MRGGGPADGVVDAIDTARDPRKGHAHAVDARGDEARDLLDELRAGAYYVVARPHVARERLEVRVQVDGDDTHAGIEPRESMNGEQAERPASVDESRLSALGRCLANRV